jgi:hypothetical protein
VNGDSLKIQIGGVTVLYNNGVITNADGSLYTGKEAKLKKDGTIKYKGFLKSVVNSLNKISSGGTAGNELVSRLSNSILSVVIKQGEKNQADRTITYWNPDVTDSGLDVNGNTTRPSFIGLAHELSHNLDYLQDTRDMGEWFKVGEAIIRKAEIFATNYENRIRFENGLALRAYYTNTGLDEAKLLNGNISLNPSIFLKNITDLPRIEIRQISSINK